MPYPLLETYLAAMRARHEARAARAYRHATRATSTRRVRACLLVAERALVARLR